MIVNHSRILEVVRSGDEEGAREIANEHVRTSYGRVLEAYENEPDMAEDLDEE
jgi:DNA-binding GntR family transcriptional regulator